MFNPFLTGSWTAECTESYWLWTFIVLFAGFIPLTIIWLKIVYTRFEISMGIPIEYGTLFVANNLCGLMFFQVPQHRAQTRAQTRAASPNPSRELKHRAQTRAWPWP